MIFVYENKKQSGDETMCDVSPSFSSETGTIKNYAFSNNKSRNKLFFHLATNIIATKQFCEKGI